MIEPYSTLACKVMAEWMIAPAWQRCLVRRVWPGLALQLDAIASALTSASVEIPRNRWAPGR